MKHLITKCCILFIISETKKHLKTSMLESSQSIEVFFLQIL